MQITIKRECHDGTRNAPVWVVRLNGAPRAGFATRKMARNDARQYAAWLRTAPYATRRITIKES
jgi:hypothetical protein